jgi:hypothetical protein
VSGVLVPEVCRAHRSEHCTECDELNDDLWVHPRDLPPAHEECSLCTRAIATRLWNIANLEKSIEQNQADIEELQAGKRHTKFHEQVMAP